MESHVHGPFRRIPSRGAKLPFTFDDSDPHIGVEREEVLEPGVPLRLTFHLVSLEVLGVDEVGLVHGRDAVGGVVIQGALHHTPRKLEALGGVQFLARGSVREGGGAGEGGDGDESKDGVAHDSGRWWRACAVNSDEEPFPKVGKENILKNIPSSDCRSGRRGVEETDEREPQESAVAFVLDCVTNVVGMSQELTSRASRAVRSTGQNPRGGEKISHTSDPSLRSYIAPRPSSVTATAPDTRA